MRRFRWETQKETTRERERERRNAGIEHEKVKSNELKRIIPQQILYSCILNEQHGLETFIISTNTNECGIYLYAPYTVYHIYYIPSASSIW